MDSSFLIGTFRLTNNIINSYDGTSDSLCATLGVGNLKNRFKAALSKSVTGRRLCANGGSIAFDNKYIYANFDRIYIGRDYGNNQFADGNYNRIVAWPTQLSDTRLQQVTTL